jgi:hypothetical protein
MEFTQMARWEFDMSASRKTGRNALRVGRSESGGPRTGEGSGERGVAKGSSLNLSGRDRASRFVIYEHMRNHVRSDHFKSILEKNAG